jgi:hypothetical protein
LERGGSSAVGRGRAGWPAVFKRRVINLRNCYIWLVDSFECTMMHGLANPKHLLLHVWAFSAFFRDTNLTPYETLSCYFHFKLEKLALEISGDSELKYSIQGKITSVPEMTTGVLPIRLTI